MLLGTWLLEHGVQRRDDWHAEVTKQTHDVAAGGAAEDAKFMLNADNIRIREVKEIGGPQVGVELLLFDFEPDFGRVVVTLGHVVDRDDKAVRARILGGDGRADVVSEGCDAASSWQVIADECDLLDLAIPFHQDPGNQMKTHGARSPSAVMLPGRERTPS